jgi:hypothetical protein
MSAEIIQFVPKPDFGRRMREAKRKAEEAKKLPEMVPYHGAGIDGMEFPDSGDCA